MILPSKVEHSRLELRTNDCCWFSTVFTGKLLKGMNPFQMKVALTVAFYSQEVK